jgi:hypothetical protein
MTQAIAEQRLGMQNNPRHPTHRENLARSLLGLGEVQLHLGNIQAAATAAGQGAQVPPGDPRTIFGAASLFADCASHAVKDGKMPEAERDELARKCTEQALAVLGEAINNGFKDKAALRKAQAFDPLRSRDDFKALEKRLPEKK